MMCSDDGYYDAMESIAEELLADYYDELLEDIDDEEPALET